uniref:Peptidase inhibitor 16 n=1 Tax=Ficedula albicollis TaxID=59894 RepID=A0A803VHC4_FICAL
MLSSGLPPVLLVLSVLELSWSLSDEEKKIIVDEHNKYRSQVSPPARAMMKMTWDTELEALAQSYAEKCIWDHNKERGRRGENLFAMAPTLELEFAVEDWNGEEKFYNLTTSTCVPGQMCGHYTQVVWSNTHQIGCGAHFCEKIDGIETENMHLLVCNYYPPGNMKGKKPYMEGPSCTTCPKDTVCVNNLCELVVEETTPASVTMKARPSTPGTAKPEPTVKPEPTATAKPEPTAKTEPTAKPGPTAKATAKPEPTAKQEPTAKPEPTTKPKLTATAKPEPTAKAEPTAPVHTTAEAETTPVSTTSKPAPTTPVHTTAKSEPTLVSTTAKPEPTTTLPTTTTAEPPPTLPTTAKLKPPAQAPFSTAKPKPASTLPTTTPASPKPTTPAATTATAKPKPTTPAATSTAAKPKPTTAMAKPTPTTPKPALTTTATKPTTTTATKMTPTPLKPTTTASTTKPTPTTTTKLTPTTPNPTTTTTTAQPKTTTTVAKPTPTTAKPSPTVAKPKLATATAKPAPTTPTSTTTTAKPRPAATTLAPATTAKTQLKTATTTKPEPERSDPTEAPGITLSFEPTLDPDDKVSPEADTVEPLSSFTTEDPALSESMSTAFSPRSVPETKKGVKEDGKEKSAFYSPSPSPSQAVPEMKLGSNRAELITPSKSVLLSPEEPTFLRLTSSSKDKKGPSPHFQSSLSAGALDTEELETNSDQTSVDPPKGGASSSCLGLSLFLLPSAILLGLLL